MTHNIKETSLMNGLQDFNCNSFTNDCVGFLTGGSIPDFIKGILTQPSSDFQ